MKTKLLLLLLALCSFSCLDEEETPPLLPDGTYVGQFKRSSPNADYGSANVTLVLDGNTFSGNSDKMYYPAIGKGTYYVSGQNVTFHDNSLWTANFDWTLILDGEFTLTTQEGGTIVLTKRQGDLTDVYWLKRQPEVSK